MTDFTKTIFISLDNISAYDTLIKKFIANQIDTADAKNLKSISIDADTHKIYFYRADDPSVDGVTPAYTIDLSGYDDAIDNLNTLINGINTKIGTVPDNKTVISFINEVLKKVTANESAISDINNETTGIYKRAKNYTDSLVGTIPLVKDDSGEAVPAASTVVDYVKNEISSVKADGASRQEKLDTLIGEDTSKSVRKIANEELVAQLLTGKADADFKTLKELAAWLEDHPEEVSAINLSIKNLQNLIGSIPTDDGSESIVKYIQKLVKSEENRATGVETGIDSRLKNVETSLGNSGSVNEKISEAINALDYTYDGIATDIVVGVSQVDGVISVEKADLVFATENQIKELFSS